MNAIHDHHDHGHHGHSHGHAHAHAPVSYDRAFAIGVALNLGFVAIEATYGILGNALALVADAGHNLSDVLGLLMAWASTALARKLPTARYTYGLRGSTILAALANAAFLLIVTGAIAWEAVLRFLTPEPVASTTMMIVAAAGVIVNGVTAWLFAGGRKADLNIRGAYLHMAADAGVSVGVVVAGALIAWTGLLWIDPAVTVAISAVIVVGTWNMLRQSLDMALDAVPARIDPGEVRRHLESLDGVAAIHDLHIWAMSTTETALTCHLVMPGGNPGDAALARIADDLYHRFGIGHATIQVETGEGGVCALEPDHVV
ncbi:MAG TPA: cation diffusion facilitator family transporter [Alphaproteobacteria bacterium]|nr:cation diffusion facilitator family transporter [Alphaproteobacteria bacterium]